MKRALVLSVGLSALAPACIAEVTVQPGDKPSNAVPSEKVPPISKPPYRSGGLPPAISGGTLIVARDGVTAIAADPDRDSVYVVDLNAQELRHTIDFGEGDEPGRLAEG